MPSVQSDSLERKLNKPLLIQQHSKDTFSIMVTVNTSMHLQSIAQDEDHISKSHKLACSLQGVSNSKPLTSFPKKRTLFLQKHMIFLCRQYCVSHSKTTFWGCGFLHTFDTLNMTSRCCPIPSCAGKAGVIPGEKQCILLKGMCKDVACTSTDDTIGECNDEKKCCRKWWVFEPYPTPIPKGKSPQRGENCKPSSFRKHGQAVQISA